VGVCGWLLGVIFGALGNSALEASFLAPSFGSGSKSESESLSVLSVDALASLLSDGSEGGFVIESDDSLFRGLFDLGREYLPLLGLVCWSQLKIEGLSDLEFEPDFNPPESVWLGIVGSLRRLLSPRPIGFDSAIISDIPELFSDFGGKHISLLWRGGRDGFDAQNFHDRCDGHAPTLTLIEDTAGNIFGGFTPVAWDSSGPFKGDRSLKTFLFTLKNPHNFPPRKFTLKAKTNDGVLLCDSLRGPWFHGPAIGIWNRCNANTENCTYGFHSVYTNDTGLDGNTFFTCSKHF
jgi:hypothetical protein